MVNAVFCNVCKKGFHPSCSAQTKLVNNGKDRICQTCLPKSEVTSEVTSVMSTFPDEETVLQFKEKDLWTLLLALQNLQMPT